MFLLVGGEICFTYSPLIHLFISFMEFLEVDIGIVARICYNIFVMRTS